MLHFIKKIINMKRIFITYLLSLISVITFAQYKSPFVDINKVDSVEIRSAQNPFLSRELCVSREHFDSIFFAGVEREKKLGLYPNHRFCRIVLTNPEDYTLFIKIFNSLEPLLPHKVTVLPNDVKIIRHKGVNEGFIHTEIELDDLVPYYTNDPIQTNTKYLIYLYDNTVITCFASEHYLDYNNWRYDNARYLDDLQMWFRENGYSK